MEDSTWLFLGSVALIIAYTSLLIRTVFDSVALTIGYFNRAKLKRQLMYMNVGWADVVCIFGLFLISIYWPGDYWLTAIMLYSTVFYAAVVQYLLPLRRSKAKTRHLKF